MVDSESPCTGIFKQPVPHVFCTLPNLRNPVATTGSKGNPEDPVKVTSHGRENATKGMGASVCRSARNFCRLASSKIQPCVLNQLQKSFSHSGNDVLGGMNMLSSTFRVGKKMLVGASFSLRIASSLRKQSPAFAIRGR